MKESGQLDRIIRKWNSSKASLDCWGLLSEFKSMGMDTVFAFVLIATFTCIAVFTFLFELVLGKFCKSRVPEKTIERTQD